VLKPSLFDDIQEFRVMPSNTANSRHSIYETITNKLIAAIEADPGDPIMPWQRHGARPVLPVNAVTGQPYRGVNILSLWVTALQRGYASSEWATFKQWVRRVSRMKGVTSWVREQCPALSPHPACRASNGAV